MHRHITIIGSGLAGYQLAREFRKQVKESALTIITENDGRFYSKPLLSTAFTQKKTMETLTTATAERMAMQLNAEIKTHTRVTAIDPVHKTLQLENHPPIPFDQLVLAVGADVIKAPLAGDASQEVFSINHIYHYSEFQTLIQHKKKIAILGAGLIGCEFANDLTNIGYEVHVIAPVKAPLELLVPQDIGELLQQALEKNGVRFHLNCTATRVDKIQNGYQITLSNEESFTADFVLSAIGLKPHLTLAKNAGILCHRGIMVNPYLETSAKDIYAIGDCAEVAGHVLPFIAPLLNCTRALAKTLSGEKTAVEYPAMPITVKTPAHPIVVYPPPKNIVGQWKITVENNNVCALFYDAQGQLQGFVLTNEQVKEKDRWAKLIPKLF